MLVQPMPYPSAVDDLSDLFDNGEIGDYWIFNDEWTSGNAHGDPITTATGTINARVLTAGADTPFLQSVSGNWSANFNGSTDDAMKHPLGTTVTQPGTIIAAFNNNNNNGPRAIVTGSSTILRWQMSINGGGNPDLILYANAGPALDSTFNAALGTHVWTAVFDGANSLWRKDGTQVVTGSTGNGSTDQVTLGALWDNTFPFRMDIYALLFIDRILTGGVGGELDRAERALGAHGGITW